MKEYKIVKQKAKMFGDADQEFEDELNKLAKEGWHVVSVCCMSHTAIVKAYLERDKLR